MTFRLLNRYTNACLWEGEADALKSAVSAAVAAHADLVGANFRGADLGGADLVGADLVGADLRGADLRGADLVGADLGGANLRGANLIAFRDDYWAVLSSAPAEVPALIQALKDGQVDGSSYTGPCACLVGTIANARHCDYAKLPGLTPNASRPAEVWFTRIKPGDTAKSNDAVRHAIAWAETWLATMRAAFGPEHGEVAS